MHEGRNRPPWLPPEGDRGSDAPEGDGELGYPPSAPTQPDLPEGREDREPVSLTDLEALSVREVRERLRALGAAVAAWWEGPGDTKFGEALREQLIGLGDVPEEELVAAARAFRLLQATVEWRERRPRVIRGDVAMDEEPPEPSDNT